MKIAVGCDHGGYVLLASVMEHLKERGIEADAFGSVDGARTDYPKVGEAVAKKVACGEYDFGIVMCGTGIGISLAANKVRGIRCANVSEAYSAAMSRRHNNCNMLALGGRTLGDQLALTLVDAFLDASFEGGRHEKRVGMIIAIEEEESSDTLK